MKNDDEKQNSEKKKKGIFAMILESMRKTGGCCGAGESCGSLPDKSKIENRDEQENEQSKKST